MGLRCVVSKQPSDWFATAQAQYLGWRIQGAEGPAVLPSVHYDWFSSVRPTCQATLPGATTDGLKPLHTVR